MTELPDFTELARHLDELGRRLSEFTDRLRYRATTTEALMQLIDEQPDVARQELETLSSSQLKELHDAALVLAIISASVVNERGE